MKEPVSASPHSHNGKYKILYIEDDEANRQLVEFILERRTELTLLEAENGHDGIKTALNTLPHLILLDLSLPDIDGFTVLKELMKNDSTQEIPIVALSGQSTPSDIDKGLAAGFKGYLTKPIDIANM